MTTKKTLNLELLAAIALYALIALLYSTDIVAAGALSGTDHAGTQLLAQMWMTVAALVGIPIALKLFHIKYVRARIEGDESRSERQLLRWGTLRVVLVAVPMVIDIWFYFLFGEVVSFFYLSIIEALSFPFLKS